MDESDEITLMIKPLSVNQCWQGKRFKTPIYKQYEKDLMLILPELTIPDGYLKLTLGFGFSSKASDWDNPIKPFVDILQKQYDFNDNRIKQALVNVANVKKGREFITFKIEEFSDYE